MFEVKVINLKEVLFQNNKEFTGVYIEYFEDGLVKYECSYKNGIKNGIEWIYYPNEIVKEVRKYIKGELKSFEEYSQDFALIRSIEFKNDVKDKEIIWDKESDLETIHFYRKGKKIEEIKFWYRAK